MSPQKLKFSLLFNFFTCFTCLEKQSPSVSKPSRDMGLRSEGRGTDVGMPKVTIRSRAFSSKRGLPGAGLLVTDVGAVEYPADISEEYELP